MNPRANAHCAQIYQNEQGMQYGVDEDFWRILRENAGEKEYRRRNGLFKSTIHWGQRKLLISEIEFLTIIGQEGLRDATVVYAGAAPGTHIRFLATLFPLVRFVLVDPAPFSIRESHQIEIIQEMFTDELAKTLGSRHRRIYFISDIRSTDPFRDEANVVEERVVADMKAQQDWHFLLGSQRSILKFRLPWDDGHTRYLNGDIYLPVWGPSSTTECRLITVKPGAHEEVYRTYDNRKYERQMFYFNNVTRHSLYRHQLSMGSPLAEGIDHCYDCKAEIEILRGYLTEMSSRPFNHLTIGYEIARMSREISKALGANRTLASPNPDPELQRDKIIRRQWIDGRPAYAATEGPRKRARLSRETSDEPENDSRRTDSRQRIFNSRLRLPNGDHHPHVRPGPDEPAAPDVSAQDGQPVCGGGLDQGCVVLR